MTSKGSLHGQLQRALDAGDLARASALAAKLPLVPLPIALRLTLLILDQEPGRFEAAARRLLIRLAAERSPSLQVLAETAADLQGLQAAPRSADRSRLAALFFPLVRAPARTSLQQLRSPTALSPRRIGAAGNPEGVDCAGGRS